MIMRLGLLVVVINRIVYIKSAMYPHRTAWSHRKAYQALMLCYKKVSKKITMFPENPMRRCSNDYRDLNIDTIVFFQRFLPIEIFKKGKNHVQ